MKYKNIYYSIQKKEDIPHVNTKNSWKEKNFPTIRVVPGEKKIHGSSTVMSNYHYRMDTNMGGGNCTL